MNRIVKRMAVPVGAAIILGSSGFAFMASSYVAPSQAGSGTGVISGYNVTNISYDFPELANSQSQPIRSVSFQLNGPATDVDAWISQQGSGSVLYPSCTSNGSGYWTCTTNSITDNKASLQKANGLTVSAAQ